MKANFNFNVIIDDNGAKVVMKTEEIDGLPIKTMKTLIKVFEDVENKVQKAIATSNGETKENPEAEQPCQAEDNGDDGTPTTTTGGE